MLIVLRSLVSLVTFVVFGIDLPAVDGQPIPDPPK